MKSQNELLHLINQLEKEIHQEQESLAKHKSYFANLGKQSGMVLISILLPAFLAGWRGGKAKKGLKGLTKFLVLQGLSQIKR